MIDDVINHIQNEHSSDQPLICQSCGQFCPSNTELEEHMLLHYDNIADYIIHDHVDNTPLMCQACGEFCMDGMELERHMVLHYVQESAEEHIGSTRCKNNMSNNIKDIRDHKLP